MPEASHSVRGRISHGHVVVGGGGGPPIVAGDINAAVVDALRAADAKGACREVRPRPCSGSDARGASEPLVPTARGLQRRHRWSIGGWDLRRVVGVDVVLLLGGVAGRDAWTASSATGPATPLDALEVRVRGLLVASRLESRALPSVATGDGADARGIVMTAGGVLCRVGLHRDRRERLRTGEWVYRCRRCDRVQGRRPLFTLMGPGAHGGGGL